MRLTGEPFGLSKRIVIQQLGPNHYALVKERKSRIIMTDGYKILSQAEAIRGTGNKIRVSLLTTAGVCSKTRAFLAEQGIEVIAASAPQRSKE